MPIVLSFSAIGLTFRNTPKETNPYHLLKSILAACDCSKKRADKTPQVAETPPLLRYQHF
jgi:hypothetical protein